MFTIKLYAHIDIFKVILNFHECHPTINMSGLHFSCLANENKGAKCIFSVLCNNHKIVLFVFISFYSFCLSILTIRKDLTII